MQGLIIIEGDHEEEDEDDKDSLQDLTNSFTYFQSYGHQ
jgi:hypothetical protein